MFNWLTAALCNLVWEGETPLLIKNILFFLSREKWIDGGHSQFFVDDSVLCAACGVTTSIVSSGMAGTCGRAGVVMLGEGERPVLPKSSYTNAGEMLCAATVLARPLTVSEGEGIQLQHFNLVLNFANRNVL